MSNENGLEVAPAKDTQVEKPKLQRPPMYQVVMLNDDYTPMDFVVMVLVSFFNIDSDAAVRIMLDVHQKGQGHCGVYTRDVAETKVAQVIDFARQHDHPLLCKIEKV